MSYLLATSLALGALALVAIAYGPQVRSALRGVRRASRRSGRIELPDPGLETRAERRAERLLREVVGQEGWQAYRALGFLYAFGPDEADGAPGYGYLIYPHRPLLSFDARSGELLSELCVTFTDGDRARSERLPDADDALAKWMAVRGDERGLLARANVHAPGRQIDPDQARRDIARLSEWTARSPDELPAA